ncbi:F-box protein CPR1-like [Papaver somniferum]|uniref:F-box protein CPR1-like n=1 Tax=Papaver somniferum TaxID=3469 RepID=UPI000E6F971A|nr:F-box protein CPR1-like [Papaver somniferum]
MFGEKFVSYLSFSGYVLGYESEIENYMFVVTLNVPGGSVSRRHGVLANESIHWLALPWNNDSAKRWVILSFHLSTEMVQQLPPPKPLDHAHHSEVRIYGFEGSLCLLVNKNKVFLDIWVQKDYRVSNSWTKQFTISSQPKVHGSLSFVQPLKSFNNGEILMLQNDCSLVLYDPESKSLRTLLSGIEKV